MQQAGGRTSLPRQIDHHTLHFLYIWLNNKRNPSRSPQGGVRSLNSASFYNSSWNSHKPGEGTGSSVWDCAAGVPAKPSVDAAASGCSPAASLTWAQGDVEQEPCHIGRWGHHCAQPHAQFNSWRMKRTPLIKIQQKGWRDDGPEGQGACHQLGDLSFISTW